LIALRKYFL